jgi:hypothetical protein
MNPFPTGRQCILVTVICCCGPIIVLVHPALKLLSTAITYKRSFIKTFAGSRSVFAAAFIAGGALRTPLGTWNRKVAHILQLTFPLVYAVIGSNGITVPPLVNPVLLHFLGDCRWILAQIFGNILKGHPFV